MISCPLKVERRAVASGLVPAIISFRIKSPVREVQPPRFARHEHYRLRPDAGEFDYSFRRRSFGSLLPTFPVAAKWSVRPAPNADLSTIHSIRYVFILASFPTSPNATTSLPFSHGTAKRLSPTPALRHIYGKLPAGRQRSQNLRAVAEHAPALFTPHALQT